MTVLIVMEHIYWDCFLGGGGGGDNTREATPRWIVFLDQQQEQRFQGGLHFIRF